MLGSSGGVARPPLVRLDRLRARGGGETAIVRRRSLARAALIGIKGKRLRGRDIRLGGGSWLDPPWSGSEEKGASALDMPAAASPARAAPGSGAALLSAGAESPGGSGIRGRRIGNPVVMFVGQCIGHGVLTGLGAVSIMPDASNGRDKSQNGAALASCADP